MSSSETRRKFQIKFPGRPVPNPSTIRRQAKWFKETGCVKNRNVYHRCHVLKEETLDDIGERLEHTRQKSLKRLSQETGVSVSSVQRATKILIKLKPYKIPVEHVLHQPDPNKRLRFCNWVLEKLKSGELDANEIFLATRRGFIFLDRYVHKITGIAVTEKQSESLAAAAVWRPVRRRAGQLRPRATAVCCRT